MPGSGAEGSGRIADRIRDQVAAYRSEDPNLAGLSMTISIGMAVSDSNTTAQDLITRADEALYLAKRSGKNRVSLGNRSTP
jgi:diguanylate cyclase (GGDEF)-like protein